MQVEFTELHVTKGTRWVKPTTLYEIMYNNNFFCEL